MEAKDDSVEAKEHTNRAKRRTTNVGGIRRRIKRVRGVSIPHDLQPWRVQANQDDNR